MTAGKLANKMVSVSIRLAILIIQVYPSARHKFSTLFQNSGDLNWEVIYQIPHAVTLDIKARAFSINY